MSLKIFAFDAYKPSSDFSSYFDLKHCSVVLNKFFYLNCYDYKLKGTKAIAYKLEAKNLQTKQIKKHPRFEEDTNISKKYRSTYNDYKNTPYTRGHVAPNGSFSFSKAAQNSVFLMSNITPQNAQINNKIWNKIEQRERNLALKFKSIEVLNLVLYSKNPKYIKKRIAIPSAYIKIIKTPYFKECYQAPNHEVHNENIKHYKINCDKF
ncbi:DNA/RNA non-specific endonuclease [Campylobacter sp. VicNov18]|uniref:DNA/RNA non-specific endonuclease n=1 Tax=Campylobacter bilis TaxID=2691918 RepID=UPI00130E07FC|nr:DNA/RNA non-specific endonuclease [Campylobacter bilis]MPV63400.1 DNA/RNA non-specific endonuclease [Campylobacter hepaticus]MBM0636899.1 DNA/RNA non-specific endonuclease [Campylobacter bilis]MCC8277608.1 DNA/RNA non-specific endonuclease [Campylobacter bilis]MCC8299217.1 DNA/RNA non-specific endonuclease [Campylobacter bilis]MCC8300517.1 DNA/RNA non-specific endonuclease [Campylobacter bilis]